MWMRVQISFNPFQGFGGVSGADRTLSYIEEAISFNPFQGFGGVSVPRIGFSL